MEQCILLLCYRPKGSDSPEDELVAGFVLCDIKTERIKRAFMSCDLKNCPTGDFGLLLSVTKITHPDDTDGLLMFIEAMMASGDFQEVEPFKFKSWGLTEHIRE